MSNATTSKSNSRRGVRLGTQFRGDMAAAYSARGKTHADLALHYSPKARKDVVLVGQLQLLNFLHCEIDTHVKTVNYAPSSSIARIAGNVFANLVDAEITTSDGKVIWRRLIQSEPDTANHVEDLRTSVGRGVLSDVSKLEVWSLAELTANPIRLRNALRAISWIAGARYWPLAEFKSKALALVEHRRTVTFEDVLCLEDGSRRALVGAAVLEMACTGAVRSDLLEVPLHGSTLFHRT